MVSTFTKLAPLVIVLFASSSSNAYADSLSFGAVLTDALTSSFDLKISAAETNIKRAELSSIRADRMPQLRASYSTEFLRGLDGNAQQNPTPIVVGNTILPGSASRIQNLVSLNFNHTIIDGGVRKYQCRAARYNVDASRTQQQVALRDTKLRVVDAYVDALIAYDQLKERRAELALLRRAYEVKRRFFDAGKISKVELGERAILVQSAEDAVQQAKLEYTERLSRVGQLTRKAYQSDNTDLLNLDPWVGAVKIDEPLISNSPELKAADLSIKAAKAELSAIKRQRFLQVGLYGGLVFYGSDATNWFKSGGSLGPRQVNGGLNANLSLFDGFKNRAECRKKLCEITKLTAQRDKREWELRSEYQRLSATAAVYGVELQTKAKLLKEGAEQVSMVKRLTDSQIQEPQAYFDEQIAQLQKALAEEKTKVLRSAAVMKMQILAEG